MTINPSWSYETTITSATLNVDLFKRLLIPKDPTFSLQYTTMVQARKHRKKRINKK